MARSKVKLLVFAPHGAVELLDGTNEGAKQLWASDDDQDFAEEFEDILDPEDSDDVDALTDYLIERELLDEDEEFEIETQFLDNEAIEGEVDE